MNNPFGVGGIERVGDFNCDIQQPLQLQRPSLNHIPQGLALQIFHHQENPPLVLADLVNCADVGMIQRGRRTRFAAESLQSLRITGEGIGQKFEGDKAAELEVLSLINHTHPTAPDFVYNAVVGNGLPDYGLGVRHSG